MVQFSKLFSSNLCNVTYNYNNSTLLHLYLVTYNYNSTLLHLCPVTSNYNNSTLLHPCPVTYNYNYVLLPLTTTVHYYVFILSPIISTEHWYIYVLSPMITTTVHYYIYVMSPKSIITTIPSWNLSCYGRKKSSIAKNGGVGSVRRTEENSRVLITAVLVWMGNMFCFRISSGWAVAPAHRQVYL